MQIKQILFDSMDLNGECGQLVAKSISNDGILGLQECKITKPGYESFSVGFGNKQVIKL